MQFDNAGCYFSQIYKRGDRMKSEKGVTLTSLVLYIMLVLIVLGILVTLTTSFQNGIKNINDEGTSNVEIDKFNIYFLKEVKKKGNKISSINSSEITFTTDSKYTFKEGSIYLNDNIKISDDIDKCVFSKSLIDGKTIINVNIKAKNSEEKTIEYVLNDGGDTYNYEDEGSYTHDNLAEPIGTLNDKINTI